MAREQLGICAEPNLHGLVFLLNARDGYQSTLRLQLAKMPMLIQRLSEQFSEANLTAVLAVGVNYWDTLYPSCRPNDFQPFPSVMLDEIKMPAAPSDLFLQIRADRYDVLHLAAQQSYQLIQAYVDVAEQIHCFRYLDGRELTGFIDQPDAPKGRRKKALALIDQQQPELSGGSYLHYQRYRLDLTRWQQLTQQQQEAIMGRKKLDGTLLAMAQRLDNSHANKAELVDAQGEPLPLLFQNMPFGQLKVQGLLCLGFSHCGTAYPQWLARRVGYPLGTLTAAEYHAAEYDLLLDYTQADAGAVFFAPSISFIEQQAGI
jgi:putative iron-dependent peroxidase